MSKRNDWPSDEDAPWLVEPGAASGPPRPARPAAVRQERHARARERDTAALPLLPIGWRLLGARRDVWRTAVRMRSRSMAPSEGSRARETSADRWGDLTPMMRRVDRTAGWIDPQKGLACLVLDCGHVRLERFEGEYTAPAEAECSRCEEDDAIRERK